jgi:serine/threonine protein kinase
VSVDAPEGLCPECLYRQALEEPGEGQAGNGEKRSPSPVFVPPTPAELARRFPQLEILELVGQGGMGAVYKARQPKLDRLLAIKILPPEVARDSAFAERFMREAQSLARLNHPNIVTIFDFGETDGLFYFTMEFVDGKNVRQLLQAEALTPSLALQIVPQVCDALRYAHDEGVVHRDIKPENILLDKKGRVKIADFGLAKIVGLSPAYLTLTGTHEVMGTLYYMAPEQMKRSHMVDHRADLYSLGVVFYEMLTGELPVGRFAPPSHKARVDGRLDPIVLRALSREPEHRYQDAVELKKDVETVAVGGAAQADEDPRVRLKSTGFVPPGFFEALGKRIAGQPFRLSPSGAWPTPPEGHRPTPVPSLVKPNWPSVRFTIPLPWSGGGKAANGEIYRNDDTLIVEFRQAHWGGLWWSDAKELRIPLSQIMSISCQTDFPPGMGHLPKWVRKWGTTEIVIKATHPKVLADLPAGKHGRGRLVVHAGDREAAKELVDSIVRPSPPAPAHPAADWKEHEHIPVELVHYYKVRSLLFGPVIGLFLTALGALVFALVYGAIHTGLALQMATAGHRDAGFFAMTSLLALPMAAGAIFLFVAALRMAKMRSYVMVVIAAVLAVLPWSPAVLLGLPFGIWALRVLRRAEVMAAFAEDRESMAAAERVPQPPPRAGGKFRSFFRSVGGYLLTRFSQRGANPSELSVEPPPAPSPPLAPTGVYLGEPPVSTGEQKSEIGGQKSEIRGQ